ncbi:Kiwa anti-phage protein KwaB-like domain-containing protein [Immundisolibacter cernigliae]|uniref:DUF4868 domain-containing protein n=1 Tax=Immundisolibacter cernigliae TaxID=1810504 RepID=A0A1B1YUJ9_9GAMM|nr:Kiwa anti-phage protein KwaB-like domain-containing protein [Immundisolibacter cernigliae]ANX04293.1 hypothetical protein PG2T_08975 [Immundisolibacter cernigliae]
MLENFQLAAIVKQGAQTRLLRIPLHQALQDALSQSWQDQYDAFVADVDEIDFNAGYQPEEHERFRLPDFALPDWLANENSQTVPDLDAITDNENLVDAIRGIVGVARNDRNEELMLFQNFSKAHVIQPGRFLFLQNNTYETTQRPGLTLDGKLSAVYLPADNKLLFHNFRTVNTFLPLADFYEEASEQEIRGVLNHDRLTPEDPDALATGANQWFRKRFAMLRDSGILDRFTAQQIANHSEGFEVDIHLDGDQIVFPSDRAQAKRLLQFLNEEIFRGAITETLYETNSKREAD